MRIFFGHKLGRTANVVSILFYRANVSLITFDALDNFQFIVLVRWNTLGTVGNCPHYFLADTLMLYIATTIEEERLHLPHRHVPT